MEIHNVIITEQEEYIKQGLQLAIKGTKYLNFNVCIAIYYTLKIFISFGGSLHITDISCLQQNLVMFNIVLARTTANYGQNFCYI